MVYRLDQFEADDREFCLFDAGTRVQVEPKMLRLLVYSSICLNSPQEAEIAVHMAAERNPDQARMATLRFDLAHERGYAARSRCVTKNAAGSAPPAPTRS